MTELAPIALAKTAKMTTDWRARRANQGLLRCSQPHDEPHPTRCGERRETEDGGRCPAEAVAAEIDGGHQRGRCHHDQARADKVEPVRPLVSW